jgi:hypothetical protein
VGASLEQGEIDCGIRVRIEELPGRWMGYTTGEGEVTLDPLGTHGSTSTNQRYSFLWAALHELGHAQGAEHSENPTDVMYLGYNSDSGIVPQLTETDAQYVKGITE